MRAKANSTARSPIYDKAIDIQPDFAIAHNNRGIAVARKGELDRAIADFNKAIDFGRNYAKAFYADIFGNRGTIFADKGEHDLAIADYNEAIRLKSDYAEAFNNRGNSFAHKGEYDRAIADYDKAADIQPDYAVAFNNRGIAFARKGEYDRAIADFDKSLRDQARLRRKYSIIAVMCARLKVIAIWRFGI